MADETMLTTAGQKFKVTSPDRVFYSATGTTKLDGIRYSVGISTLMTALVQGRPAIRKRRQEGVAAASFFVNDLEPGAPPWLSSAQIRHGSGP